MPVRKTVDATAIALPVVALTMVGAGILSSTLELADAVAVALIVVGAGTFFIGALAPVISEFKIGPGGFSAKLRERDDEVRSSLEPDSERLLHTATLLAGNPEQGRELLETALIETYVRWQQAKREGPADTVRKLLADLAPAPGPVAPIAREKP